MSELTEQEKAELEARVARGVALLDRELPDWRERVDVAELDMGSCTYCVLGYTFGTYVTGLFKAGIVFEGGPHYGFEVADDEDMFRVYDYLDLWTKEIQR